MLFAMLTACECCTHRDDVAVNPNDTEESIWAFLCEAQLCGADTARTNMLQVSSHGSRWCCSAEPLSALQCGPLHKCAPPQHGP